MHIHGERPPQHFEQAHDASSGIIDLVLLATPTPSFDPINQMLGSSRGGGLLTPVIDLSVLSEENDLITCQPALQSSDDLGCVHSCAHVDDRWPPEGLAQGMPCI